MEITAEVFLTTVAVASGIGALGTVLFKSMKWFDRQNKQDQEIQSIKEEQCLVCFGLMAALDGLKQLGANGTVTEAHEKMQKHLNLQAHE